MSDIDNLLEELVKNIGTKLDDQQKEIDALKDQNNEFHKLLSTNQNHLNDISSKITDTSVKISEANTSLTQIGDLSEIKQQLKNFQDQFHNLEAPNQKISDLQQQFDLLKNQIQELKNTPDSVDHQTSIKNNDICSHPAEVLKYHDLTQLPAFTKSEIFKEIRRPVDLNELYMMVLQSTRTINELQMNVDNICRRN